ncbi:MAG: hypothetical protein NC399_02870 [Muribaculum sp.]|nr:hypothetical protein [Muribaculum sp.]
MAIVRDYQDGGHCRIIVHDDYFRDRSKEEVDAIIDRVSAIVIAEELRRSRERREREAGGEQPTPGKEQT